MSYKKLKDFMTGNDSSRFILRKSDSAQIPLYDDANTDFMEYKAWLAEGNTPEEAD